MNEQLDPGKGIGEELVRMDRQELVRFVARLCLHLKAEQGARAWRGGLFPENIHVNEAGEFSIGPAKTEKWTGQELEFIAPELYWNGETSPAADVYSLGLLLYYGLGNGRLPFETATSSGQLARMSGKPMPAPKSAGKRLADVMEKATAYHATDRYQSPEELQIMLESCLDNKYLSGSAGGASVFGKKTEELSEIERMMVEIMESGEEPDESAPEESEIQEPVDVQQSPEELAGLSKPEPAPTEQENVSAMVEEFFGSLSEQENSLEENEEKIGQKPSGSDEPEDVRVYEPAHDRKDRQPIPILTEEKNPELAPVVLRQQPRFSRNMTDPVQQQKVVEQVKVRRSRRPLIVVLCLCVLLVVGALIAKPFLDQRARSQQIAANAHRDPPDPNLYYNDQTGVVYDNTDPAPEQTEPVQTEQPEELPRYLVSLSDMTWTQAQAACREQGGYLAVISNREEFDAITTLADAQGITHLWVGCRRVDDELVWETGEQIDFFFWAEDEPTYYWNGVAEDYIMLYREGDTWYYNDNSNDPANEYPAIYSGHMGYACEFER